MTAPLRRLAPDAQFALDDATRTVSYIFSNPAVARDGHTIAADAWDLMNFMRNPVFLWAHDDQQPPIGRVTDIESRQGLLVGSVQYPEPDIYPFADTVYRLVKARYLNAVSTCWIPRAGTAAGDSKRPKGMDFTDVELLEISQVPVPAVPGALATARSAGIDTGPIFEWCERILDGGNCIIVPRAELEVLRRDAKPGSASTGGAAERRATAERRLRAWQRREAFLTSSPK